MRSLILKLFNLKYLTKFAVLSLISVFFWFVLCKFFWNNGGWIFEHTIMIFGIESKLGSFCGFDEFIKVNGV